VEETGVRLKEHELLERTYLGKYLKKSSASVYQLMFFLPLLVIYEVAAVILNFNTPFELRNGADILLKYAFYYVGIRTVFSFVFAVLLFVSLLLLFAMKKYGRRVRGEYFTLMFLESLIYGALIGLIASRLVMIVSVANPFLFVGPSDTFGEQLMIGIGAGVYEEVVFRGLLITLLVFILRKVPNISEYVTPLAVIVSSVLFSVFHYWGPFGETFLLVTFIYRLVAGILLSALYMARGIGTCAWSHAIYDVYVVLGIL
jgi:membrane protease YdiL (CAAX protease family)